MTGNRVSHIPPRRVNSPDDDRACDNSTSPMPVTSAQVRMARAALNWTVRDLAEAAGVHRNTISNIEVGRYGGDPRTLQLIEQRFKAAGVEFIDENGGGAGVRLRKPSK